MDRSAGSKTITGGAPNARQTGKEKTRRVIVKAAEQLFSRQGIDETHAEDIARRARVGVGTIYLHFGDKNGLLHEILLKAADELDRRLQQQSQTPPASASGLVRAQVEALVAYVEEEGRLAGLVLSLMVNGHPAAKPMLKRAVEQAEKQIIDFQKEAICRLDINPQLAARAVVQMNLGLLAWWAEDPSRSPREEIIDTLTKFRSSGLSARTPG